MAGAWGKTGWMAIAMAALLAAPAAFAADPDRADSPSIQAESPQGAAIQALIGEEGLQPTLQAAVVRLGPADADWSDNGLPILLPLTRSGRGGARGSAASPGGDSLTCLTQAVYYEARGESREGQQGVAQVVLNRSHSARYPSSICSVVFQRAGDRGTCQFTFACDGQMSRPIEADAWDRAKGVASQALGGFVYKPLETATHYHAAWMTPYWSSSLTRIRQIGGHVFYQ